MKFVKNGVGCTIRYRLDNQVIWRKEVENILQRIYWNLDCILHRKTKQKCFKNDLKQKCSKVSTK